WQIIFVLIALYSVAEIVRTGSPRLRAIAFCGLSLYIFYASRPVQNVWNVSKDAAHGNSLNGKVVHEVGARSAGDIGRSRVVYVTFAGDINAQSQNWLALKRGLAASFFDRHRSGSIDEHLGQIRTADFVEVADPNSKWLYKWLPSSSLQAELLGRLRNG